MSSTARLFETFRDNAAGLRARQRQDGNTAAKYIRNEYGGYAAGPVLIPKLYNGKNKTFWFFDWEGMKQRQNQFAITGVPTAAMWNGDLSNITDSNGDHFTIYDPATTTGPMEYASPFPNNVIPANRISQTAKIFQSVTPTPNIAGNLNPWIDQNFQTLLFRAVRINTLGPSRSTILFPRRTISRDVSRSSPFTNAQAGGHYGYPPPGCTDCGGTGRAGQPRSAPRTSAGTTCFRRRC